MNTQEFSFIGFRDDTMPLPYVSMGDIAFQIMSDAPITSIIMVDINGVIM